MDCPICLEPTGESIIFSCQHSICLSCYQSLLDREITIKCPLCRLIIEETPLVEPIQTRLPMRDDRRIVGGCGICITLMIIGVLYAFIVHK